MLLWRCMPRRAILYGYYLRTLRYDRLTMLRRYESVRKLVRSSLPLWNVRGAGRLRQCRRSVLRSR